VNPGAMTPPPTDPRSGRPPVEPATMHLHLERFGLPVGLSTILGAAMIDYVASHAMTALSVAGMTVGIACTLITTTIKVSDWRERRLAKREHPIKP
jgi:hypothetical protein